ncbi:unnamed protein product [Schistocephalus solidus]|uniref:Reverse transcriptase domain-containing protein n=1 Tax=Schistocephalus solidus TaxID=70667 RepID=A0A183TR76_SCHSO|nr:unnamed protein product [Schistocephalus solidus]
MLFFSYSLRRTPHDPDKHPLPPTDAAKGNLVYSWSIHWHLLNYVVVRRRDQQDVLVTKAIPVANECIDHCLVISIMKLRLQPRRRPQANIPIADVDISVENLGCQLRDTIQSTAMDILSRAGHQHQDWSDENDAAINALFIEKKHLHIDYVNHPTGANKVAFYRSRRLVKQRLREMQDIWISISISLFEGDGALFQEMRHQGQVSQDIKDAIIVHLYSKKGNHQLCDNHRKNSLLNIARKIFSRILLNHLNAHLEQRLLLESQCAFRRHRGTTDMIFAPR